MILCLNNVDTLNICMKEFGSEKMIFDKMQGVKCPIYSYIFLYLEDSPTYSYIFLYLEDSPIYSYISGYQEMLNSYFKKRCYMTEDRPHIIEATVCAIRTVKDAVDFFDSVSN